MNVPLNIGILGCAAVAEYALIEPAKTIGDVAIGAVASRDPARGRDFARRHGIGRALSYEALLADPELDAIYIPLPNSMHFEWAVRAIEMGKAVLCEKPLVANYAQAIALHTCVRTHNGVLMEAMHWRYHPLASRMMEIIRAGRLGELRSVTVEFLIPASYVPEDNIRSQFELGGGSTMDSGVYCVNLIRMVLGEPVDIISAQPKVSRDQVDTAMHVRMTHAAGAVSAFTCSQVHPGGEFVVNARVEGARGHMFVEMPFMPQWGNFIETVCAGETRREEMTTIPTYHYLIKEFAAVARGLKQAELTLEDSLENMKTLDRIYQTAGLAIRG